MIILEKRDDDDQIDPCVYIANKFSAFCKQTKHRSGKMEQRLQAIKMA